MESYPLRRGCFITDNLILKAEYSHYAYKLLDLSLSYDASQASLKDNRWSALR